MMGEGVSLEGYMSRPLPNKQGRGTKEIFWNVIYGWFPLEDEAAALQRLPGRGWGVYISD